MPLFRTLGLCLPLRPSRRPLCDRLSAWAGNRGAPRSDRLLRVELRSLAGRRLLPAPLPGAAVALLLRRAVRYGRGKLDLLSVAAPRRGCTLGRADTAGVPVRSEGQPLSDAREAAARDRRPPAAAPRADRAARRRGQARPAPLAATTDLRPRRRSVEGGARRVAVRSSACGRIPTRELVCPGAARVARGARRRVGRRRPSRFTRPRSSRADRRLRVRSLPPRQARTARELLRHRARRLGQTLDAWARRGEVYAYFNNDWEGFAPRNAAAVRGLVE